MSANRLTGALPGELSGVVAANATVDLLGNNFTGAVPADGLFGGQPATAYEGNQELCGPPLRRPFSSVIKAAFRMGNGRPGIMTPGT